MTDFIDISKWQGSIDWGKIKGYYEAGKLGGIIIRAGYGYATKDPKFEEYYRAARSIGIPCGAYWYAYWSSGTPVQECKAFLSAIGNRELNLGIWYDVEYEPKITSLSKSTRTQKTLDGLNVLKESGRYCGLYASTDMINNRMEYERLQQFDIWVAQYGPKCTCKIPYGIWQYSSNGSIPGIPGRVDVDHAYRNYPFIIKGKLATGLDVEDKEAPQKNEQPEPAKRKAYKVGAMTMGDLVMFVALAREHEIYITGTLNMEPSNEKDAKEIERLAESLSIDITEI